MKKLLLVISVCLMGFSLYAGSGKPFVIVHKSNGGWWAWLNLYNDVTYTPSMNEGEPAMLDCSGAGFSGCRVPRQNVYLNAPNNISQNINFSTLLSDAINSIIEKSEASGQQGSLRGTECKKIAVRNATRGGFDTYLIQGTWNYNAYGEGYLKIYLNSSDMLNCRM